MQLVDIDSSFLLLSRDGAGETKRMRGALCKQSDMGKGKEGTEDKVLRICG
jgi:hypothetical protein